MSAAPADTPVHLTDMGTGPGNLSAFAASERYVVRAQPNDVSAVEVIRLSDHKIVLKHRPADEKNFVTTFAGLAGDRLALLDANIQSDGIPDIGFIYDLSTGAQTLLSSVAGALKPSSLGAQGVVYPDGNWYYSAQTPGHFANCVAEVNLTSLHGRTVTCGPAKSAIWYVHASENTATWTVLDNGKITGCRAAQGIRDGKSYAVGPAKDCDIFDASTLAGWQLWSDQLRTDLQPYIALSANDGSHTVRLGDIHPQSLVVCGGYAYWLAGGEKYDNQDSMVRWRPGDLEPKTVLALASVPVGSALQARLWVTGCNDNVLTMIVTRYYVSDPKATVQVLAVEPPA